MSGGALGVMNASLNLLLISYPLPDGDEGRARFTRCDSYQRGTQVVVCYRADCPQEAFVYDAAKGSLAAMMHFSFAIAAVSLSAV